MVLTSEENRPHPLISRLQRQRGQRERHWHRWQQGERRKLRIIVQLCVLNVCVFKNVKEKAGGATQILENNDAIHQSITSMRLVTAP